MSYWTYVNGTVIVSPMGRTQAEKRYILDTVLSHLPRVIGSEGDMNVYVIQKSGFNSHQHTMSLGNVLIISLIHMALKAEKMDGWMCSKIIF